MGKCNSTGKKSFTTCCGGLLKLQNPDKHFGAHRSNPAQSSPVLTILAPLRFIMTEMAFFSVDKLLVKYLTGKYPTTHLHIIE